MCNQGCTPIQNRFDRKPRILKLYGPDMFSNLVQFRISYVLFIIFLKYLLKIHKISTDPIRYDFCIFTTFYSQFFKKSFQSKPNRIVFSSLDCRNFMTRRLERSIRSGSIFIRISIQSDLCTPWLHVTSQTFSLINCDYNITSVMIKKNSK